MPGPGLNVICHGSMICRVEEKGAVLHAPYVDVHVYGIGSLDALRSVPRGSKCELRFTKAGASAASPIDGSKALVFDQSKGGDLAIDPATEYCTVHLPALQQWLLFRAAGPLAAGETFFAGPACAQYGIDPETLPLIHVFRYEGFESAELLMDGVSIDTYRDDADENLHVFAEPVFTSTVSHLGHLLSALKPKPDMNVTPAGAQAPVPPPDSSGTQYGITPDDMKTLHELWQDAEETEALRVTHPTNCMMAYLT